MVARVLRELNLEHDPGRWLVLLQQLCEGNQDLKDQFFARLEHKRRPATAHQMAAFLAGLMGWRLILTTNFDTLYEQALRSQSLDPTIYELPEQGPVPDPRLVRSHFALVKLHGGAFGRLMSESLKYSLRRAALRDLLEYFPRDPLLLVLGYSGGDRRVMSLVEALVRDEGQRLYTSGDHPRVLWVCRSEPPSLVLRPPSDLCGRWLVKAPYRNGGRFLQELYCRLATSHPVSATTYRAFPHMAPAVPCEGRTGEAASPPAAPTAPVVVFHATRAGRGTSTTLAEVVKSLAQYEVIWCDLEAIPTVDGLVTYLQNRFRRFDPGLPPFAFLGALDQSLSAVCPDGDPRVHYVARAMRRGKYVIAIDSMGEFGTSFHSYAAAQNYPGEGERIAREADQLHRFLNALVRCPDGFGESRLLIAHTTLNANEGVTQAAAESAQPFVIAPREADVLGVEIVNVENSSVITEFTKTMSAAYSVPVPSPAPGDDLRDVVRGVWNQLGADDPRKQWALALAACFRRRRDLVVLRRLLFKVICRGVSRRYSSLADLFRALGEFNISGWDRGVGHNEVKAIDDFLNGLHPFLVRQEGGFYWMHRVVRNEIYHIVREGLGGARRLWRTPTT